MTDVSRLPDGLEDAYARVDSFCSLLAHLAESNGGVGNQLGGAFCSLTELAESIRVDLKAVIEGKPRGSA